MTRSKDKHAKVLCEWARAVNFTWNYINELSSRSIRERGKFLSAYDLQKYTDGAGKELGLHSHTIQCIGKEYVTRRKQFKKSRLSWRKSSGSKRSLGWIPVNTGMATWKNGQVYHNGQYFGVWDSFGLGEYKFRSSSFNEDSRGRWYFNVVVEVPELVGPMLPAPATSVGIDLGLKTCATASNGQKIEGRFYRALECKLGIAQRARKKARTKAIHAKIGNQRKDMLHKFSTELVKANAAIFVGNVASSKLVKTKMAKSTLDAGWSVCVRPTHIEGELKSGDSVRDEHHAHHGERGSHHPSPQEAVLQSRTQAASCPGLRPARCVHCRVGIAARHQRQHRAPLVART